MVLMHVNDLLDWRIIESGNFTANLSLNSISTTVAEMVDLMNSTLVERNLTIVQGMSNKLPKFAIFDKRRYQQVLLNLLSNAVKYSH